MRFLYVADLHLRQTRPEFRNDDWPDVCLNKLQQITDIASDCDFILCGGDVFDSYNASLRLVRSAARLFKKHYWYLCLGNHDMRGHNVGSYRDGPVGFLEEFVDSVRVLEDSPDVFGEVTITAHGFRHGIDGERHFPSNVTRDKRHRVAVVVAHAHVLDHEAIYDHVVLEDVETDADLFLCAHNHRQFSPRMVNGTVFCAPGSILRTDATEQNKKHRPMVLVVDVEGRSIKVSEKLLEFGEFDEVFEVASIERKKQWTNRIDDFVEATQGFETDEDDVVKRIRELAESEGIEQEVVDLAVERVFHG